MFALIGCVLVLALSAGTPIAGGQPLDFSKVPVKGMVTMIDLGAKKCIPCKMMAPILEELKKQYAGVFEIEFIDVWQSPAEAEKYGIQTIPTQIFFDASGKEVFRHVGFFSKEEILAKWKEFGVERKEGKDV